jgi:hypothetical protein
MNLRVREGRERGEGAREVEGVRENGLLPL